MIIIASIINHKLKNTRFYLNSAVKVYIYYKKLLFNIYKKKILLLIYTANHIKFNILEKNIVFFNMFINSKSKVVNFYIIFYTFKLKYNFFLIDTIEKLII